ncbi:MAG: protein-L-isoaspartate(D-aspartate) O-methyltransferase [candidate division Zixibacteria bacterium]|nr:protein-L-isoaspartate(D-aspartate) O-methyltransferase [candidate division Zixibacteria bacterium]
MTVDPYQKLRERMVAHQIEARGVKDQRVLGAMRKIPRHFFLPEEYIEEAYSDEPVPIGLEQTISQPYIVAVMTELLALSPKHRVLEVGTGSGYQTAILAELAGEVYSLEIVAELGKRAADLLTSLGYKNVWIKIADGYNGWAEMAPFDAIIVTACAEELPPPLLGQLKNGGRLVAPLGTEREQYLYLFIRTEEGVVKKRGVPVRFVPLTRQ